MDRSEKGSPHGVRRSYRGAGLGWAIRIVDTEIMPSWPPAHCRSVSRSLDHVHQRSGDMTRLLSYSTANDSVWRDHARVSRFRIERMLVYIETQLISLFLSFFTYLDLPLPTANFSIVWLSLEPTPIRLPCICYRPSPIDLPTPDASFTQSPLDHRFRYRPQTCKQIKARSPKPRRNSHLYRYQPFGLRLA